MSKTVAHAKSDKQNAATRSHANLADRRNALGAHVCVRQEAGGLGVQPQAASLVRDVLSSPGQPLDAETRSVMEPRFGRDFSTVRVHTDAPAAESAVSLNASAYTIGHDVVFGAGGFSPGTDTGRRLLAHELTHVVQQGRAGFRSVNRFELGNPDDSAEREATSVAGQFGAGKPLIVQTQARTAQRAPQPASAAQDFVESAIGFLNAAAMNYQADLRIKSVKPDEGRIERQLIGWKDTVEKSEGILDQSPTPNSTLKQNLHSAYQSAVQALVDFVADRSNTTRHSTFEKYRELIPEWALPQDRPKNKGDELSQSLPVGEREQLKIITGSVNFGIESLFSTKTARTTIPLPKGVTARFSSQVPPKLQDGLRNVAGTIIPQPLELNSTMTLALDLEPYGGAYNAYRFTFVEHKPKRGKPTQEVLIEDLGTIGVEGSTTKRQEAPQAKFKAHGFKRNSGWKDEEFAKVLMAVGKIPDAILSPVDGISFARKSASNTDPKAGGDYNPDSHTITMYDREFGPTTTRFGRPGDISDETVRAVEHEVGHATDLLPLRKVWKTLESKQEALKTAFAEFENPPGSNNYSFPSTEQARFNELKARIAAAEAGVTRARSASGERYKKDASGMSEMVEGGSGAGTNEFRQAALKDGGKRITEYSRKEWQEYYAESFSFYISDPDTLQRLRPHVFAFFRHTLPR
jgi:Domain of unknown function (DUF4157)